MGTPDQCAALVAHRDIRLEHRRTTPAGPFAASKQHAVRQRRPAASCPRQQHLNLPAAARGCHRAERHRAVALRKHDRPQPPTLLRLRLRLRLCAAHVERVGSHGAIAARLGLIADSMYMYM